MSDQLISGEVGASRHSFDGLIYIILFGFDRRNKVTHVPVAQLTGNYRIIYAFREWRRERFILQNFYRNNE
jgi:hypothetical protein